MERASGDMETDIWGSQITYIGEASHIHWRNQIAANIAILLFNQIGYRRSKLVTPQPAVIDFNYSLRPEVSGRQ